MDVGAVIGAIGVLATTVGGLIGVWWLRILNKRHEQEMQRMEAERKAKREEAADARKVKKEAADELRDLVTTLQTEVKSSREDIHRMSNRLQTAINNEALCKAELGAAVERIDHLEDRLEEEGIKIKRKESGSKRHTPLAPEDYPPPPTGDEG